MHPSTSPAPIPFTDPDPKWSDPLVDVFYRVASGGWVPARWFLPHLPKPEERAARTGRLHVEIVSHCWNYAHFLAYQLSSLVNHPPRDLDVTMTVYYSDVDDRTVAMLDFFAKQKVPGLTWNWRAVAPPVLFRRAIGRNHAALNSTADWVWFTDCDLMFRNRCLDTLATVLQGRRDALVFPRTENVTGLLPDDHPLFATKLETPRLVEVDESDFFESSRGRATGPLQIAHGDVCRACGYCNSLNYYQKPSATWRKAREDRAFRWLLRSQGVPLDIPGVYRLRHVSKGRYTGRKFDSGVRTLVRKFASRPRER